MLKRRLFCMFFCIFIFTNIYAQQHIYYLDNNGFRCLQRLLGYGYDPANLGRILAGRLHEHGPGEPREVVLPQIDARLAREMLGFDGWLDEYLPNGPDLIIIDMGLPYPTARQNLRFGLMTLEPIHAGDQVAIYGRNLMRNNNNEVTRLFMGENRENYYPYIHNIVTPPTAVDATIEGGPGRFAQIVPINTDAIYYNDNPGDRNWLREHVVVGNVRIDYEQRLERAVLQATVDMPPLTLIGIGVNLSRYDCIMGGHQWLFHIHGGRIPMRLYQHDIAPTLEEFTRSMRAVMLANLPIMVHIMDRVPPENHERIVRDMYQQVGFERVEGARGVEDLIFMDQLSRSIR